jgi:hypothetical protein
MSTWTLQCTPLQPTYTLGWQWLGGKKRSFSGNRQDRSTCHRGARSLSHGTFGLWMKTQPFHFEVINVLWCLPACPMGARGNHRANSWPLQSPKDYRDREVCAVGSKSRIYPLCMICPNNRIRSHDNPSANLPLLMLDCTDILLFRHVRSRESIFRIRILPDSLLASIIILKNHANYL